MSRVLAHMRRIHIREVSDEVHQEIAVAAARKRLTIPMYTLLAVRTMAERDEEKLKQEVEASIWHKAEPEKCKERAK